MNAEIDADTIKRYHRGERLTEDGWVHFFDEHGNSVVDPEIILKLTGKQIF
jgi:hypothetical protein